MSNKKPQVQDPQQPKTPTQLKREELESLSDAELDERYKNTFQTEGPEMSREQVIEAIMGNSPAPGANSITPEDIKAQSEPAKDESKSKTFTSKDNGKEYTVQGDTKGLVVVRQVSVDTLNGSMVEVPNTEVIQTYTPEKFQHMLDINFFSDSRMKVEVLQGA